jgi:hypothetical protein
MKTKQNLEDSKLKEFEIERTHLIFGGIVDPDDDEDYDQDEKIALIPIGSDPVISVSRG